jgi:mRNA interferase HicA
MGEESGDRVNSRIHFFKAGRTNACSRRPPASALLPLPAAADAEALGLPEARRQSLLLIGHLCPILCLMKGNEFIRKVRKLGRQRGVRVAFVPERGKGSHGTLYYGDKLTIVRNPKDELKTGTLHAMLAQLGLTLAELTDL